MLLGLVFGPEPSIPSIAVPKKSEIRRAKHSILLKSDNSIALRACRVAGAPRREDLIADFFLLFGAWAHFRYFGVLRVLSWGALGTLRGSSGALLLPLEAGLGPWVRSGCAFGVLLGLPDALLVISVLLWSSVWVLGKRFRVTYMHTYIHTYIHTHTHIHSCLLYTSPSPRDLSTSRMPSSA